MWKKEDRYDTHFEEISREWRHFYLSVFLKDDQKQTQDKDYKNFADKHW